MKTYPIHLLLALAATLTASAKEIKPPADRRPPPQPLLRALDADRDGQLSPAEIAGASAALGALDKNEDGMLTRREIHPPLKKKNETADVAAAPARKGPLPLVRALDLDKDGILSAAEIEAAPVSLAVLDRNEDGTISRRELKPGKRPVEGAE